MQAHPFCSCVVLVEKIQSDRPILLRIVAWLKSLLPRIFRARPLLTEWPQLEATAIEEAEESSTTAIEGYELGEELGTGTFSRVLLAMHAQREECFALKLIPKALFLGNEALSKSVQLEILALQTLKHKNCVGYVEHFENKTHLCIVTEFVSGGELYSLIAKVGRLQEHHARRILFQLLCGVSHVHSKGFAHRDLKLENILLDTADVETCNVKLIDFGLAARAAPAGTLLNERCGSEEYAAPEVLQGLPYDGCKADVWSFGVVAFACLAGSLPFNHGLSDSSELQSLICKGKFTPPPWLSQAAKDFIGCLLRVPPDDRPTTAQLMEHDFWCS